MKFSDLSELALANLWRQKLRTLLTVVGVAVGVAALVLMVSLGIGIKRAILKQMDSTNLLTEVAVLPIKFDLAALFRPRAKVDAPTAPKKITQETIEALRGIEGIRAVYPNFNLFVHFKIDETQSAGELYGLPPEAITEALQEALICGRMFADATREALVSGDMMKDMGFADPALVIGKKVVLTAAGQRGRRPRKLTLKEGEEPFEFEIVGVFDAGKYKSLAPRIYTSLAQGVRTRAASFDKETLAENPGTLGEFPALTIRVTDFSYLGKVKTEVEKLGYGTMTIQDLIEMVENVFLVVEALLGCVGGVGLLVSFFGIANTMLMSILERTREIGIMKAVGGTRRNIASIFLVEASAIGLMGGGLGIFGGWVLGQLGNAIATWYAHERGMTRDVAAFDVSLWLGGGAIVFSVVVSVAAGLYPAWRAARLDPVVALRHE